MRPSSDGGDETGRCSRLGGGCWDRSIPRAITLAEQGDLAGARRLEEQLPERPGEEELSGGRLLGWTSPRCWRAPATSESYTELALSAEDLARP